MRQGFGTCCRLRRARPGGGCCRAHACNSHAAVALPPRREVGAPHGRVGPNIVQGRRPPKSDDDLCHGREGRARAVGCDRGWPEAPAAGHARCSPHTAAAAQLSPCCRSSPPPPWCRTAAPRSTRNAAGHRCPARPPRCRACPAPARKGRENACWWEGAGRDCSRAVPPGVRRRCCRHAAATEHERSAVAARAGSAAQGAVGGTEKIHKK